jgi:hypothetical protein
MIYFPCPKCSARLSADPARVGQAALCGKCKVQVTVPPPPVAKLVSDAQLATISRTSPAPRILKQRTITERTREEMEAMMEEDQEIARRSSEGRMAGVAVIGTALLLIVIRIVYDVWEYHEGIRQGGIALMGGHWTAPEERSIGFGYVMCIGFLLGLIFALWGAVIGSGKGRSGEGVLLGFFLGPIGLACTLFLDKKWTRKCPFCLGGIPKSAVRCCHCTADLAKSQRREAGAKKRCQEPFKIAKGS